MREYCNWLQPALAYTPPYMKGLQQLRSQAVLNVVPRHSGQSWWTGHQQKAKHISADLISLLWGWNESTSVQHLGQWLARANDKSAFAHYGECSGDSWHCTVAVWEVPFSRQYCDHDNVSVTLRWWGAFLSLKNTAVSDWMPLPLPKVGWEVE